MGMKTFKYRLYPSKAQERNLWTILDCARNFYNMCLGERKFTYQLEGRSVTKNEQIRNVKHYKSTFPQAAIVHSHVLQTAVSDVDKAFQAFFRRVKAGEKPGYPRFKGRNRWRSFGFKEYGNGFKVDGRRLKVFGVGRIPVRWHRLLEGEIKTLRIIHQAGRWYACFTCDVPTRMPLLPTGKMVGLDMGLSALITTSDGEKVENPNYYREGQTKLRLLQRALARKKKGSKNRRKALLKVQRQQGHVANQRSDYLHKLSTEFVRKYDLIALEDLRVRNMVRNHHLSKSILDSGWSIFRQYLTYKAGSAGREIVFVDPAYTSKSCSSCGAVFADLTLAVRWVECECGLSLDRDHNAAINVLIRALNGWDTPVQRNVAPLSVPDGTGKRKRAVEAARL